MLTVGINFEMTSVNVDTLVFNARLTVALIAASVIVYIAGTRTVGREKLISSH